MDESPVGSDSPAMGDPHKPESLNSDPGDPRIDPWTALYQFNAAVNTGDANRALLFGSVRNYDRHCQERRLFATLRYLHLIHRSTLLRTTVTNVGA